MFIPRIRGRVGQADESGDHAGKWFFNILIADIDLEQGEGQSLGNFGPYETKQEALDELGIAVKMCSDAYTSQVSGQASDRYWDMKDNQKLKKWK